MKQPQLVTNPTFELVGKFANTEGVFPKPIHSHTSKYY